MAIPFRPIDGVPIVVHPLLDKPHMLDLGLQDIAAQRRDKATGLPRIEPANVPTDEQIREALRDYDLDMLAHWIKRLEWADEVTSREVSQRIQLAQTVSSIHIPLELDDREFRKEMDGTWVSPSKTEEPKRP